MTVDMVEDMSAFDGETDSIVKSFMGEYDRRLEKAMISNPGGDKNHYYSLRNAVFVTFGATLFRSAFFAFIGECTVITFTTYLIIIIDYLKDENAPVYMGYIHASVYSACMIASVICKNES
jgi:hypothetical protein